MWKINDTGKEVCASGWYNLQASRDWSQSVPVGLPAPSLKRPTAAAVMQVILCNVGERESPYEQLLEALPETDCRFAGR